MTALKAHGSSLMEGSFLMLVAAAGDGLRAGWKVTHRGHKGFVCPRGSQVPPQGSRQEHVSVEWEGDTPRGWVWL